MKTTLISLSVNTPGTLGRRLLSAVAVATMITWGASPLQAQTDNFADGNDTLNPTWTHSSGYVGSSGQSWTVSGGVYRLQAPNNGLQSYGYVGSFVGLSYTDVRVSADFLNFSAPAGGAFGLGARLTSDNSLGVLSGYGYAYEPFASSGVGEMVLYRINNGVDLDDLGSVQLTLNPGKQYTFELDVIGTTLHGRVFEVNGGLLADQTVTDATYASGVSGVFGYSNSALGLPASDFSVDNVVVVPEPAFGLLLGLGGIVLLRFWRRGQC
jgi:hypothetical protein